MLGVGGGTGWLKGGLSSPAASTLLPFLPRQDSALGAAISVDQNWLEMQIKKEITTM